MINGIPINKRKLAKKLSDDINLYLDKGGTIYKCHNGESGGGSPLWRGIDMAEKEVELFEQKQKTKKH